MSTLDLEHASDVLADAWAMGDRAAAALHGISRRTVERYRARIADDEAPDADLSALVAQKIALRREEWGDARQTFLRRALAKLEQLLDGATAEDIPAIVGAIKIVGELELTGQALGRPTPHPRPNPKPAAPPARALPPAGGGAT